MPGVAAPLAAKVKVLFALVLGALKVPLSPTGSPERARFTPAASASDPEIRITTGILLPFKTESVEVVGLKTKLGGATIVRLIEKLEVKVPETPVITTG